MGGDFDGRADTTVTPSPMACFWGSRSCSAGTNLSRAVCRGASAVTQALPAFRSARQLNKARDGGLQLAMSSIGITGASCGIGLARDWNQRALRPSTALKGQGYEFCNCDFGCGCNFGGFPNSKDGSCRGLVGIVIDSGTCGDVDLSGLKCAAIVACRLAEGHS